MTSWKNEKTNKLAQALLSIDDQALMVRFLRDLLTEPEIIEFAGRFAVARALYSGKSQRTTAKETGVSIATVTRVNQWLKRGMNGYLDVLGNLEQKTNSNSGVQLHHHHKA